MKDEKDNKVEEEIRTEGESSEKEEYSDIDLDDIDLSNYLDSEIPDDEDEEKVDEDFVEVGGKLKQVVPYLVGGLLTVVVLALAVFALFFGVGKKDTTETETGAVSASVNNATTSAEASGNDVIFLEPSGNDAESAPGTYSYTEDETSISLVETSSSESLAAADATTSSSFTALSHEFLDSADYEDVSDLIEEYFVAYGACDLNEVLSLVDYNGGTQITQEEMDERAMIVEDYRDFEFYIIEGMDTSSYVVYASYGIKFYNIDTLAPTLTRFYVTSTDDGSLRIYNGEVTSKLNAYLNSVNDYDCVNELSESINEALKEACEADETLKALMEILYGSD